MRNARTVAVAAFLAGTAACGHGESTSAAPAPSTNAGDARATGSSFDGQPFAITLADDGMIRVAGIALAPSGEEAFLTVIDPAGTAERRVTHTPFPNQVWLGGTVDTLGQGYVLSCPYMFRPTLPLPPGSACWTVKLTDAGVPWRVALALHSITPAGDGGIYGIAAEVVEPDGAVSGLGNSLSLVDAQGHVVWKKPVVFPASGQAYLTQLARRDDGDLLVLAQISDTPWIARFSPDGDLRATMRLDLAGSLPSMISPAHGDGAYVIVNMPSKHETDLVRVGVDGALAWTRALGNELAAALAVAPDDGVAVAIGTFGNAAGQIAHFDATGAAVGATNVPADIDVGVLTFDSAGHLYAAGNLQPRTLGSGRGYVQQLGAESSLMP